MNKKEDRIRGAASLHIKIGQLERYCELMVELGEVSDLLQLLLRVGYKAVHRNQNPSKRQTAK